MGRSIPFPGYIVPCALCPVPCALCPELAEVDLVGEARADCLRCPMVPEFNAETRCCTYHPHLANFLAGRALSRDGEGAERLRARIGNGAGVSAWGIYPPPELTRQYVETVDGAFGRDRSFLCPYFVGGEQSCGIWEDRPGTCRTWFCKHDDGELGAQRWMHLESVLWQIENRVAFLLIDLGDAPTEGAAASAFEEWFAWCSERANGLTGDELARVRVDALEAERHDLITVASLVRSPLPDVLIPAVEATRRAGERVLVTGYSRFDAVSAPTTVFAFLADLDGKRTWREAVSASPEMTEEIVRELYRVGALADPTIGG